MIEGRCPNCRAYHIIEGPGDTFICPACGVMSTIEDWHDCHLDPVGHFGIENICLCGGEFWYIIYPNTSAAYLQCDRCGCRREVE